MSSPQESLRKLHSNLQILQEREAKYAGDAPVELINQIKDHHTAISLTRQWNEGELTEEVWNQAMKPLLVAIKGRTGEAAVSIGDVVGGIHGSIIAGGDVKDVELYQTGDISTTITAGGDVVGRDKIINNITQIKERALTAAEAADKAQTIARQRLAEAVTAYVERIGEIAADDQDALQGGPYRGLKAYTLREAEIFFGRDEAMTALLAHLQRGRLTILHAESGAGKSSLLQAGIQYQLIVQGHVPLYIRPYDKSPALAIKLALLPGLDSLPDLADASLRDYLHQVTTVLGPQTISVILIDQFEELFFNLSEEARQCFVEELAACLEDEALNVRWVLALRTEFFGNLANFRPRIRNPFENDFRLNRLPPEQARTAIEEPVRRLGIDYEPALVETLLDDLRDSDSGEVAPAQLQLVCLALYNLLLERQRRKSEIPATITLAMYNSEGRAGGILRDYLQRVMRNELKAQDRELARQLLIALVSSDQRRIRRTKSELVVTLSTYLTAAQSLDGVLEQLVDSRLLNVDEDEQTDELSYELAHDLLLKQIEIDPETLKRKAAQELLKQEVDAFERHETLLDPKKFDIINSQRQFLQVDAKAEELLRLSQDAVETEEREKEAQRQRELKAARTLAEEQRKHAEDQTRASKRLSLLVSGLVIILSAVACSYVGFILDVLTFAVTLEGYTPTDILTLDIGPFVILPAVIGALLAGLGLWLFRFWRPLYHSSLKQFTTKFRQIKNLQKKGGN